MIKKVLWVSCVTYLGVFVIALVFLHASPASDEKDIWKNEKAYMEFLQKEDPLGMMSFWNEQGIGWPMGMPKPSGNNRARKVYVDILFSQVEVVSFKIQPMAIKVFGDVAVVHYFIDWVTRDSEGIEKEQKTRITHTWMKTDGQWRIIGGMSSE